MGIFNGKSNTPRFVEVYSQKVAGENKIFVDTITGVNYYWHRENGYGGGMTVLVGADGKPVVTPPETLMPQ